MGWQGRTSGRQCERPAGSPEGHRSRQYQHQGGKATADSPLIINGAKADFGPGGSSRDLYGLRSIRFVAEQDVSGRNIERHQGEVARVLHYRLLTDGADKGILVYLNPLRPDHRFRRRGGLNDPDAGDWSSGMSEGVVIAFSQAGGPSSIRYMDGVGGERCPIRRASLPMAGEPGVRLRLQSYSASPSVVNAHGRTPGRVFKHQIGRVDLLQKMSLPIRAITRMRRTDDGNEKGVKWVASRAVVAVAWSIGSASRVWRDDLSTSDTPGRRLVPQAAAPPCGGTEASRREKGTRFCEILSIGGTALR